MFFFMKLKCPDIVMPQKCVIPFHLYTPKAWWWWRDDYDDDDSNSEAPVARFRRLNDNDKYLNYGLTTYQNHLFFKDMLWRLVINRTLLWKEQVEMSRTPASHCKKCFSLPIIEWQPNLASLGKGNGLYSVEQSHKSNNAPAPHHTIHRRSEQKCAHLCFKQCIIVGCETSALWDL